MPPPPFTNADDFIYPRFQSYKGQGPGIKPIFGSGSASKVFRFREIGCCLGSKSGGDKLTNSNRLYAYARHIMPKES